ncbi:HAD-IA family hydrolase [Candidatus Nomurabacteria bacterium]|nr:HAD-IA family hydrolase [Candidatus Kaiserbacteria bacterium]MCB9814377.1 HAD-IA family hydrolase [Candidatus Nomurabacteria bacterium]
MNPTNNNKYKAVVFDYGGVLETNTYGSILGVVADYLNVPLEEFKSEYFKYNHLANVGSDSWDEMFLKVVAVFDASQEARDFVLRISEERDKCNVINQELVSNISLLREKGYLVAVFSNYTKQLREILNANGLLDKFDKVVISGEIGFQKPSKEAFDALFSVLELEASEVVFIDDTPKSLESADVLGYTPVLYKNNEQLWSDLGKLGITV